MHVCCAALSAVPGLKLPILLILLPRLSAITLVTALVRISVMISVMVTVIDGDCGDVMQVSPVSKYSYGDVKSEEKRC